MAETGKPRAGLINAREHGILLAVLLFWAVCAATNGMFRDLSTYSSILRESSFVGVAAIGMTFCIISGDFDLSVGSMLSLLGIAVVAMVGKTGLFLGTLAVTLLGALCGTFNGLLVAGLRIPAFIATLAMYYIYRALAYIVTNGNPVQFQEPWFTEVGNGSLAGVPTPFVFFLVLVAAGTFLLRKTPFGRSILAIGNSARASQISGIRIARVRVFIFALVGAFTGIAAMLISSRMWSANSGMKIGYEFDVIAAVVLGGTSLAGGKGSLVNTLFASIFFASLNTAMNMFHVNSFMQRVVIGIVLLFAFSLSGVRAFISERLRLKRERALET
ncbi:MAG TPA: ABC transporter permease [Anaeromyxobacteraceae bacterium]|nr:ABC transporter permease [Anaeromyxobacteraceae bacterium]